MVEIRVEVLQSQCEWRILTRHFEREVGAPKRAVMKQSNLTWNSWDALGKVKRLYLQLSVTR